VSLLAVDPGIRGCGAAVFTDGKLVAAAYVKNPLRTGNRAREAATMAEAVRDWALARDVDEIAVEWMKVYWGDEGGKDPNDLLALCGIGAAVAALTGAETTSYLGSEWKRTLKKEPCHARIRLRLDPREKGVAEAAVRAAGSLGHNVMDAVGIGLHHLRRLGIVGPGRRRVLPA
jgi:hypothetical protein